MRLKVVQPPPGVMIQLQRGRSELLPPKRTSDDSVLFEFTVRVRDTAGRQPPRLLGEFVQGPATGRFLYVNSGKRAGQADSCWDRRAKVTLMTITAAIVAALLNDPRAVLEGRIAGTGPDGGPACATVPLLDGGWRVVPSSAA